ncbi:hypothetical protein HPP92_028223 [Vanilla planifolia]|uniref:Uncharacterized protein n=1 Tax=Vanilla planifolia TaxID=51239 RepID=A0A835U323_VANPL|nr:hypothetical protein HPP92_028223 [Vanilla planifolia]
METMKGKETETEKKSVVKKAQRKKRMKHKRANGCILFFIFGLLHPLKYLNFSSLPKMGRTKIGNLCEPKGANQDFTLSLFEGSTGKTKHKHKDGAP